MTREPPLRVRDDLTDVDAYVSPQLPARYRLNTNESPYAPPQALVSEVTKQLEAIALNRYPDRDATDLYAAISSHVDHPTEGLWVANGSNEVFMHLFLGFGGAGRSTLLFEPTYSVHSLIPRIATTEVMQLDRSDDFSIDVDAAVKLIDRDAPEIVIVCSPNNPTGNVESLDTIRSLLEAAPGLVVVDEAYAEFARPEDSAIPLLDEFANLVVTKTFSKAWRLAGVRIGYMLAQPELIDELARVRLPYHLSTVTQLIGVAAIRHSGETLELVESLVEQRERASGSMRDMGLKVYPSQANFVLFEVEGADSVWKELLERDVLVRDYSGVSGLEDCLRVTAGLPDEMDAFLAALKEVV